MLGLVIRILVLCSVVFAVVYAITRALRAKLSSQEAQRIQGEIRDLRAAVDARAISAEEYAVRSDRIRRACEQLGIDVPELPARLLPPPPKDG